MYATSYTILSYEKRGQVKTEKFLGFIFVTFYLSTSQDTQTLYCFFSFSFLLIKAVSSNQRKEYISHALSEPLWIVSFKRSMLNRYVLKKRMEVLQVGKQYKAYSSIYEFKKIIKS